MWRHEKPNNSPCACTGKLETRKTNIRHENGMGSRHNGKRKKTRIGNNNHIIALVSEENHQQLMMAKRNAEQASGNIIICGEKAKLLSLYLLLLYPSVYVMNSGDLLEIMAC